MGLKDFFKSKPDPEKEAAKKNRQDYYELAGAIAREDVARVKALVAGGVNLGYYPKDNFQARAMSLAYHKGNAAIFEALLDSQHGAQLASTWVGGQSKTLEKTYYREVYFSPYMIRTAIEEGKQAIALLLARKEGVDVELGGGINYQGMTESFKKDIMPVSELARLRGMTDVADAIDARMKPVEAERRRKAAAEMLAKADALREEAEKLRREAEELHPAPKPPAPMAPPNKLNP